MRGVVPHFLLFLLLPKSRGNIEERFSLPLSLALILFCSDYFGKQSNFVLTKMRKGSWRLMIKPCGNFWTIKKHKRPIDFIEKRENPQKNLSSTAISVNTRNATKKDHIERSLLLFKRHLGNHRLFIYFFRKERGLKRIQVLFKMSTDMERSLEIISISAIAVKLRRTCTFDKWLKCFTARVHSVWSASNSFTTHY